MPHSDDPSRTVRSPWWSERSIDRVGAAAEIVLCSGVPSQSLIGGLLVLLGFGPAEGEAPGVRFITALLLGDTLLLAALMALITRLHGERPADLWLGPRPPRREALLGIALIPIVFFMVVVLLNVLRLAAPWLHNVPENPLEQMAAGGALDAALFGLVAVIGGGVREELQRAFMLRRFERHLGGATVGVIVLSAMFGLGHAMQGYDAVVTTGVLGAVWAVLYLRRRSSVAPIVSHAGYNLLEVLRVALVG